MITERDLKEAIAECQGVREPNANTCVKLAAFYIILDHIQNESSERKKPEAVDEIPSYSYSAMPCDTVTYEGESNFAKKIYGIDNNRAWGIIDELMDTLSLLHPNLYAGVLRKFSA